MNPQESAEKLHLRIFEAILSFFDRFYIPLKGFLGWAHGMFLMGATGAVMAMVGFGSLFLLLFLCGASYRWTKCAYSKGPKEIRSCPFWKSAPTVNAIQIKDQKSFDLDFSCSTDQHKTVCTASEHRNKGFGFSLTEKKGEGGKVDHDLFIQSIPENGAILTKLRQDGVGEVVFAIKGKKKNRFSVLCLKSNSLQNRSCEAEEGDLKEQI